MERFAVIDTETNWSGQVMSIGTVIAEAGSFRILEARYHILPAQCRAGGMYQDALFFQTSVPPIRCTRQEALADLRTWLAQNGVRDIFAYNAAFDRDHLPELQGFQWYDIMRLAAYRQYNPAIGADAECYATGKLKRGYGVEPMLRRLSGQWDYCETHNAILDALDELEIMRLLGHRPDAYFPL